MREFGFGLRRRGFVVVGALGLALLAAGCAASVHQVHHGPPAPALVPSPGGAVSLRAPVPIIKETTFVPAESAAPAPAPEAKPEEEAAPKAESKVESTVAEKTAEKPIAAAPAPEAKPEEKAASKAENKAVEKAEEKATVAVPAAEKRPLWLPTLFSDNMVLQTGRPLPIWGRATPGATVKAELRYTGPKRIALPPVAVEAKVDDNGAWKTEFPALKEGPGSFYALVVSDGAEEKKAMNCVVGEVWLASGQSNMAMSLGSVLDSKEVVAAADYPQMRVFRANGQPDFAPRDDVPGEWVVVTPQSAAGLTAVGYFFARELIEKGKTPVGIIDSSWGGMPAQSYVSLEKLRAGAGLESYVSNFEQRLAAFRDADPAAVAAWEAKNKAFQEARAGIRDLIGKIPEVAAAYSKPDFDAAGWELIKLPQLWENAGIGLEGFDGVVWFRRTVALPEAWLGRALTLRLGAIDDSDISYANGREVGRNNVYTAQRVYTVPAEANNAANLVVAVRCVDTGGGGGIYQGPLSVVPAEVREGEKAINLVGDWLFLVEPGHPKAVDPGRRPGEIQPSISTTLFNGRIAPTIPYAVRGAIWYQGESNANDWHRYRTLFPALIEDWRARWGYDFPFYWVQLANFMTRSDEPRDTNWAKLREAQTMTRALPATGQAVIIDIGEANDIHPRNKADVGHRLALWALHDVFGEQLEPSSPVFRAMTVDGARATLRFDRVGGGLTTKNDAEPGAFAIAGEDGDFVWAKAKITAPDAIELTAEGVGNPVAVRYAWDDNPLATVYSAEGLPLTPFRYPIPEDDK